MSTLISLDVDGVLANLRKASEDARRLASKTIGLAPAGPISLEETPLWWGTFEPLGGPAPDGVRELLSDTRIHIVTRRPENCSSVTVDWIQRHFPEIARRLVGISCVPFSRTKAPAKGSEMFPDVAIDDDTNELLDYAYADVQTVVGVDQGLDAYTRSVMPWVNLSGVRSGQVEIVPTVWDALTKALTA